MRTSDSRGSGFGPLREQERLGEFLRGLSHEEREVLLTALSSSNDLEDYYRVARTLEAEEPQ